MTRPEKKTERIWCTFEKSVFDVIHQISIEEDRSMNGTLRMLAKEAIAARQQKTAQ